jgi:pilus assembly protein CpaE
MADTETTWQFLNPQSNSPAAGSGTSMSSHTGAFLDAPYADSIGAGNSSIALIGPEDPSRRAVAAAFSRCEGAEVREYANYPQGLDDVPRLLEQGHDIIVLDLDSSPEYALELVESICANGAATVMVFSSKPDPEMLVRCMRAGAREFLTPPFSSHTMAEALVRASARRPAARTARKTGGRLLVFLGAKGGSGVTTLACNFAVALAQESNQSTLLIDLDLPLGDAALNLGIVPEFSTVNALQDFNRLDSSFLSKLLFKHSSGVFVLAAPGKFPQYHATNEAIDKLVYVARQGFENVIVDVGSRIDLSETSLYRDASTIYLVTQAGIPELRNSNRLISQYFTAPTPKLEIVVNRYEPRSLGVSEEHISKALTRPAQWKIPNDYAAVRRMQNTATPLALVDSPISRIIRDMARTIAGPGQAQAAQPKKKGFSLFNK